MKRMFFVIAVLALLASINTVFAEGWCEEFLISPSNPNRCMLQTWRAWVVAGKNDPQNPYSDSWVSSILFQQLGDKQTGTGTSCGFRAFDQNGEELLYFIDDLTTGESVMNTFVSGSLAPTRPMHFRLTAPAPLDAPIQIAGPVSIVCFSDFPAVLRNKIVVTTTFSLITPGGEKVTEVSEKISLQQSWKWVFPLDEGKDGNNWNHMGVAITNVATRAQTSNQPVTVRISITDMYGFTGAFRDITLNPPPYEDSLGPSVHWPGETKAFVLWTLFGTHSREGNEMFFADRYGNPRGDRILGTVTVESLGHTMISVVGTRMIDPKGIITAVPASPIIMP